MLCSSLDLPLCQDTFEAEDKSPLPFALYPDPRLWSPKTRRLEVNIVPRPRPSPNRPRIDPWSFISAGLTDRPGAKTVTSSPSTLAWPSSPRPQTPSTNCDPFPSPGLRPFQSKGRPFGELRTTPPPLTPSRPRSPPRARALLHQRQSKSVAQGGAAEPGRLAVHRPGLDGRHQRQGPSSPEPRPQSVQIAGAAQRRPLLNTVP